MPNIARVFKDEIRRLARQEARAEIKALRSSSAQYRRDIASLKRTVKGQQQLIARLQKRRTDKGTLTPTTNGTATRFSPDWVAKHREKLGLSAADYAALVGVSPLTIYNWEKGKTRPQQKQLESWGAVRQLGKREAWQRLEEMEE